MSGDITQNTINIVEVVQDTINTLCSSLFDSIKNIIFPLLDEIIFIDDKIIYSTHMEGLFGSSVSSGILILANCLLTAFVLYYVARLMLSHFTGTNIESPWKFFIKAIFAYILMNYSLDICSLLINATYDISLFFCNLGKEILGKEISFLTFANELNKTLNDSFNIFSLDGILSSALSLSSFTLIINFSLRYILIKVLIILSPFIMLCLINTSTTPFFKSWLKCFFSLLFLQILVSIILLLPFAIMKDDVNSYFNKLLLVGTILALLKSNQFVKEFIGGLGIDANIQAGISSIKSAFFK